MTGSPWSLAHAQMRSNSIPDACYVSSCEALWHQYQFGMQEHHPTVVQLQVHLPQQQSVMFNPEGGTSIEDVVESHRNKDTTLAGWCGTPKDTSGLLPRNPRRGDGAIGRMYCAHPSPLESTSFYLHLFLTSIKGATSFDDLLLTVNGVQYHTFKEACFVHGLFDNDRDDLWKSSDCEAA
jgi:hypothetical protein